MEMRRIPYVLPFYLIETFSPINAMNVTFNSLLKVGYKIPVLINYYLDGGFWFHDMGPDVAIQLDGHDELNLKPFSYSLVFLRALIIQAIISAVP